MQQESAEKSIEIKLLLVGDRNVGKSSIAQRFVCNKFKQKYMPTHGMDSYYHQLTLAGNRCIKFYIWDISNESSAKFPSAGLPMFQNFLAEGLNVIFLIYDVANFMSFDSLQSHWIKYIHAAIRMKKLESLPKLILIGNKIDQGHAREVSIEQHSELAASLSCSADFIVSAKLNDSISTAFINVAGDLLGFDMKKFGNQISNQDVVSAVVLSRKTDELGKEQYDQNAQDSATERQGATCVTM